MRTGLDDEKFVEVLGLHAAFCCGLATGIADATGLLDEGDLLEVAEGLIRAGDQTIPWFSPLGHGTPLQRLWAADIGFAGGPDACISADFLALIPEEGVEHPSLE